MLRQPHIAPTPKKKKKKRALEIKEGARAALALETKEAAQRGELTWPAITRG